MAATEAEAYLYNASATVEWEFFGTWADAIKNYYPRYTANGVITALFGTNVPYLFPVPEFGPDELFKVFDDTTVVFRPSEWRGTSGSADPREVPLFL